MKERNVVGLIPITSVEVDDKGNGHFFLKSMDRLYFSKSPMKIKGWVGKTLDLTKATVYLEGDLVAFRQGNLITFVE